MTAWLTPTAALGAHPLPDILCCGDCGAMALAGAAAALPPGWDGLHAPGIGWAFTCPTCLEALEIAGGQLDAERIGAGCDAGIGDRDDPHKIVADEVLGLPVAQRGGAEIGEDRGAGNDDRAAPAAELAVDMDCVVMREDDRLLPLHSESLPDAKRIGKRETRHAQK